MIKKRSDIADRLEDAVVEVSFGLNRHVSVRVIELKEGSKVDTKPNDVLIINGRREFVIRQTLGSLTTICYGEDGEAIVEGTRVLNNGTIYSFQHYTHVQRYYPRQRQYPNLRDVLNRAGIIR